MEALHIFDSLVQDADGKKQTKHTSKTAGEKNGGLMTIWKVPKFSWRFFPTPQGSLQNIIWKSPGTSKLPQHMKVFF